MGVFKKDETEKTIEKEFTEQRIKAKTAWNANTLRGDYADLLILEEFQLMNEDAWNEVGEPMLFDKHGTAVFIYTPPSLKSEGVSKAKDPRHATKLFKRYQDDPEWACFHFTSYDNPTLSQEALSKASESMSLDAYRREILAEDDEIELSWLVYGRFDEEYCKIPRFKIPESWPVLTGHDFGSANPAAIFVAQVQMPLPDGAPKHLRYGDYVMFKEYSPSGAVSTTKNIQIFRDFTKDYKVSLSTGGNVNTEQEIRTAYTTNGWTIIQPNITKVGAQIDRVIQLMELNKLHIFEDLYGILAQIANCMWEIDEDKRPTNKVKDEAKYHLLACLRYLCTHIPVERNYMAEGSEKILVKVW
jgi:hypothetical protein